MTATVTVTAQRGAAGETPRDEVFEVPYSEGMSLLDALIWIRGAVDPSLAKAEGARGRAALESRHSRRLRCEAWRGLLESLVAEPAPQPAVSPLPEAHR